MIDMAHDSDDWRSSFQFLEWWHWPTRRAEAFPRDRVFEEKIEPTCERI